MKLFLLIFSFSIFSEFAFSQSLQKELANTLWIVKGKKIKVHTVKKYNDKEFDDDWIGIKFINDSDFVFIPSDIENGDSTYLNKDYYGFFYKPMSNSIKLFEIWFYGNNTHSKKHCFGYMYMEKRKKNIIFSFQVEHGSTSQNWKFYAQKKIKLKQTSSIEFIYVKK